MMLIEMAEALKERGFEEVPTSILPKGLQTDNYFFKDMMIYFPEIHRYSADTGNSNGTSVFLSSNQNSVYNVQIDLPDEIQEMYRNALNQLESVTGIPCDLCDRPDIIPELNYKFFCSELYEGLKYDFSNLLNNVEINPVKIGSSINSRHFKLNYIIPEKVSKGAEISDRRLGFIGTSLETTEFYMEFLDQLPEKIERLKELEGKWTKLVDGAIIYAERKREFYQDIGDTSLDESLEWLSKYNQDIAAEKVRT